MKYEMPDSLITVMTKLDDISQCDVQVLATYQWCRTACDSWRMQRVALGVSEGSQLCDLVFCGVVCWYQMYGYEVSDV